MVYGSDAPRRTSGSKGEEDFSHFHAFGTNIRLIFSCLQKKPESFTRRGGFLQGLKKPAGAVKNTVQKDSAP